MKVKMVDMKNFSDKSLLGFHVKHFIKRVRCQEASFRAWLSQHL